MNQKRRPGTAAIASLFFFGLLCMGQILPRPDASVPGSKVSVTGLTASTLQGAIDGGELGPGDSNMGEISFASNNTATTITQANTNTKVGITTTLNVDDDFDSPSAGRLRYTGATTKILHCGVTFSIKGAGPNDTVAVTVYKNGTVNGNSEFTGGTELTAARATIKLGGSGEISSSAIHVMPSFATNDYMELAIKNLNDTDDFTVIDMNMFCVGMPS